ncbi:hypothetical protein RvY_04761 [Ramazzottius varieornatus]|uniref:Uncharacterized protein n=1 Tax=Ramazzottius varieornatus TaxID=947166 RepID=A0A1D1USQ3_RAMVA|nr:hypothetical protein RvY_04761 [Ramazzottius varieornatus]
MEDVSKTGKGTPNLTHGSRIRHMGASNKDWNTVSVVGANEYPFAELQNVPVFSLVFLLSTRHCFPGRLVSFELDFGLLISVSCFEIAVFYFSRN